MDGGLEFAEVNLERLTGCLQRAGEFTVAGLNRGFTFCHVLMPPFDDLELVQINLEVRRVETPSLDDHDHDPFRRGFSGSGRRLLAGLQ